MATAAALVLGITLGVACGGEAKVVARAVPVAPKPVVVHKTTPLVVLSVTTTSGRTEADLREDLLLALDGASFAGVSRRYQITATLVTLDASSNGSSVVTRSAVEIAVVDDTGKMLGTARGSGRVEAEHGYADAATDATRRACQEAVTSAVDLARGAR